MKTIKVKTPAKINLTLEVLNKREDGFHNIQSIMHAISLYDYLTVFVRESEGTQIALSGSSAEIPYDEKNIVYKAAVKFLDMAKIKDVSIDIFIEKNIPVAAGLAGGSTNASGTFYALNKIFDNLLTDSQIHALCASLGSDLNFCLDGGCAVCTSRGEVIEKIPYYELDVSLVKPSGFGISAKEAYTKFAQMEDKSVPNNTQKLRKLLENNTFDNSLLYNNLETAVLNDYEELLEIKNKLPNAMMSGSGPTCFVLDSKINAEFDCSRFITIEGLKTISGGVSEV